MTAHIEASAADRLDDLGRRCTAFARRIAVISVAGMLVLSLLTAVDVSLRAWTDASVVGFFEFMELTLAVAIVACFPSSVIQRSHLVVDLVGHALSDDIRRALSLLGTVLMTVLFLLLTWRFAVFSGEVGARAQQTSVLELPMAPFFWAATALMALCVPLQLIVLAAEWRALGVRPAASNARGSPTAGAAGASAVRSSQVLAVLAVLAALVVALAFAHGGTLAVITGLFGDEPMLIGAVFFIAMWVMIFLLVPLGAAMTLAGVAGAIVLLGPHAGLVQFGYKTMHVIANANLAVIPLFLMMGNFASVSGLSSDIYRLAYVLVGHRRGGLALATIGGCAGFGAVTGSSVATAATMGAVTMPEMSRRGYSPALTSGCVAAGGTLGQLVPPSTIIVLYCILVEVSIGRSFVAALVPAAITVVFYMIAISLYVRLVPSSAAAPQRSNLSEALSALRNSWGVALLFGLVVGGIYGGIFTATEAAAVGAGTAFLFALGRGKLRGGAFWQVMGQTAATTAMIYLLIIGAFTFSTLMSITNVASGLTDWIVDQGFPPLVIIALILLVYLALGAVMESHAIMVITAPIVAGLIVELGYDLIWWGIVMVVVVEVGLITPPFGVNVFVIKSMVPDVKLSTIYRGVMPFVAADLIKLIILVLFPVLTLWLPATMFE